MLAGNWPKLVWPTIGRLAIKTTFDTNCKKKPHFQCVYVCGYSRVASAGNRTRAARVAGEHSTTEPPMLTSDFKQYGHSNKLERPSVFFCFFFFQLDKTLSSIN